MTAIRTQGKVNDNTTMIDTGMYGVAGTCAVYLVEAGKRCLIDTGGPAESSRIIRTLHDLDAFPPDQIVLTHAHHDHSQGVPDLRRNARKRSRTIEVLAGKDSIPLLKDQSWNSMFDEKLRFENILDVRPLEDGDVIDLDGTTLVVIGVPGHIKGHIALYDEGNRNLFLGDSIGFKYGPNAFIPPIVPPYWDRGDFDATIERLRSIDYDSVCLGHYGYIYGEEARQLLDEAEQACEGWWAIFERVEREGRLDDTKYLSTVIIEELGTEMPELKIEKRRMRMLLGLVNISRKLSRRPPLTTADLLLPVVIHLLVDGYRVSKGMDRAI